MRIVFFNISYMEFYKGKQGDKLIGTTRYVIEKGDGAEKHNFQPLLIDGVEICRGFVEPGFTKGGFENGSQRLMHIEKIADAGNPKEKIDNVLVVWCAPLPESKRTVVVGWYKNATVYRKVNTLPYEKEADWGLEEFGNWYNAVAKKEDCVLLPTKERSKSIWAAYRRSHGQSAFGFGQSNMWYAREDNAQEYVQQIAKHIEQYSGENWV